MDAYAPTMMSVGARGMIGKGARLPEVVEAMKKYNGVYFGAIGGAGALLAKCIKKAELIAYEEMCIRDRIKEQGVKGITNITIDDANENITVETLYGEKTLAYKDCMLERCHVCKGKEHQIFDETIGESRDTKDADRFAEVEKIEAMSPEEKFAFFQNELSRCIRCNACRNVCPACSCRKCVFDSTKFDSAQKANVDSFEERMFHIIQMCIRDRCADCAACCFPHTIPS